jgi:hypothetical protein
MTPAHQGPADVDPGRPTPARIYDYMLDGITTFQPISKQQSRSWRPFPR